MTERDVLTIDEVAELLQVSPESVRHMVQQRTIPFFHVGEHLRFRRPAVMEWIAGLERDAAHAVKLPRQTLRLFQRFVDRVPETEITMDLIRALTGIEADSFEERLAGIALLFKVVDERKADPNWTAEVLSAFVTQAGEREASGHPDPAAMIEADVQAAVNVLVKLRNYGVACVDLASARLAGADLARANLTHFILNGARLDGAALAGANMAGVPLVQASLRGANLRSADLKLARLDSARLDGALLERSNCSGANFTGATLAGANLSSANLREAAGLTQEQVAEAIVDVRTHLPLAIWGHGGGSDIQQPQTQTLGAEDPVKTLGTGDIVAALYEEETPGDSEEGGQRDTRSLGVKNP